MSFPCVNPCIVCPPSIGGGIGPVDPANPFVNLSSEDPDHDDFIGRRYRVSLPPIGSTWYAVGCIGWCLSDTSQEEADLCAGVQQAVCTTFIWPDYCQTCQPTPNDPFPLEPRNLFYSSAQSCSFTCPDGTKYKFTTPSGAFASVANQDTVNVMAFTYACNQAIRNHMCFGELIPGRCCSGGAYSGFVSVSTSNTPVSFQDVTPLPDGLLLTQDPTTAFIVGTPTTPGDYVFTLKATDSINQSVEKIFNLSVLGITNQNSLPNGNLTSPYSEVLVPAGTVSGPVKFFISSGSLPPGLTLNEDTGEISGTPTLSGTYSFTIGVTN